MNEASQIKSPLCAPVVIGGRPRVGKSALAELMVAHVRSLRRGSLRSGRTGAVKGDERKD